MAPLCRTGRGHLFGTTLKSRKTLNRPFVTLVADPSLVEERLQRHLTWRTWSTTWREHIHSHAPTLWMYVLSELQWQKQLLQNTLTALHFKKVQTSTEVQKPHSNNYRIGCIDLRISVIGRQLLKLCFLYQVRSGSFFFPNAPVSASPMDPDLGILTLLVWGADTSYTCICLFFFPECCYSVEQITCWGCIRSIPLYF